MEGERDPDFIEWLRIRRPVSSLGVMKSVVRLLRLDGAAAPQQVADAPTGQPQQTPSDGGRRAFPAVADSCEQALLTPRAAASEAIPSPRSAREPSVDPAELTLGYRWSETGPGEPIRMLLAGLEKHTVILAGAGSGKTVLIRRLVEEVAMHGIPSIVIDCANDLATLGDTWPQAPEAWCDGDRGKSR